MPAYGRHETDRYEDVHSAIISVTRWSTLWWMWVPALKIRATT